MDTNISLQGLLDTRRDILRKIIEEINKWDGSIDLATKIVENNGVYFKELMDLDKKLKNISHPSIYSLEYEEQIKGLLEKQNEIINVIENEQRILLNNIKQLNKKDKIIKNYISKRKESIFIDKDL